jgi:exodeoxyribonuclease V alpha subunit
MPPTAEPIQLTGVVERIIFLNEENHYTIAEFRPDLPDGKGRAETVTIMGALPGVECGETLHLGGEWTRHAQHGAQFRIASFRSELPSNVFGIRKYLGSGLVPGIGAVYADKIVDAFGADTFRVLSEESGRLRSVAGIGAKRAAAIKRAWEEKRAERELYIFLQTYGVSPGQCVKIVQRYGDRARKILEEDPYRVAREIDGIGFKTADRIAINLGFANDAAPRIDAGLIYVLQTLEEEGHTAYPEGPLVDQTTSLLETSAERVAVRIGALVDAGHAVRHPPPIGLIQLPALDRAEQKIAQRAVRLCRAPSALPAIKIDAALEWAERKAGFDFHELQRQALRQALAHKLTILTGGPGTGKTTCLRALVDVLNAKKARVHLAAPTGRAAQRLTETTGGSASTIHRLLKFDPSTGGFTADEDRPLATDFLIVDEASMLDARLASALFQAVPARAHLLLVGDTDQLPSVGAGNVLKDLIAAGDARPASGEDPAIPVTRLSAIYRQQSRSRIVATAHAINQGSAAAPPVLADVPAAAVDGDLVFISAQTPEDCLAKVLRLCSEFLPRIHREFNPVEDVQVLAPMHKGVAGVSNFNVQLQAALNPNRHAPALKSASGEFRPGDKVIQLRNDYEKNLFNGDIGMVTGVHPGEGSLTANFDGEHHVFKRANLGNLALAYAISIHKSQGSEFPVVIVPLLRAHYMMLQRNLLYTAITRGRRKVFIVGDPAAYAMAVRNSESKLRVTHLRERLAAVWS